MDENQRRKRRRVLEDDSLRRSDRYDPYKTIINISGSTKKIMTKYGFHNNNSNSNNQPVDNDEDDELRQLVIVATADEGRANVNGDYLSAWNSSLRGILTSERKPSEIAFVGTKQEMDSVLRCVLPANDQQGGGAWPLTVAQLKNALVPCYRWEAHPALTSTIAYYLHKNNCSGLSLVEKLQLPTTRDVPMLLVEDLKGYCVESVFDIVKGGSNGGDDAFRAIADSPNAKSALKIMMQFGTAEKDPAYKATLIASMQEEIEQFKQKCKQIMDFSRPAEEVVDDDHADGQQSDWCQLLVSSSGEGDDQQQEQCYWVNRAYLATWSPVFRGMLFSRFSEGNAGRRIPLKLDKDEAPYWPLFLTLLHPTYMGCLWRLMPREYFRSVYYYDGKMWIDSAFAIIFDDKAEALTSVFQLAHRFQISSLVHFCSLMIDAKSDMSLAEKIKLADTYHLPELMELCLNKLNSPGAIKRMFAEDDQLLSDVRAKKCTSTTMGMLFERSLEFM